MKGVFVVLLVIVAVHTARSQKGQRSPAGIPVPIGRPSIGRPPNMPPSKTRSGPPPPMYRRPTVPDYIPSNLHPPVLTRGNTAPIVGASKPAGAVAPEAGAPSKGAKRPPAGSVPGSVPASGVPPAAAAGVQTGKVPSAGIKPAPPAPPARVQLAPKKSRSNVPPAGAGPQPAEVSQPAAKPSAGAPTTAKTVHPPVLTRPKRPVKPKGVSQPPAVSEAPQPAAGPAAPQPPAGNAAPQPPRKNAVPPASKGRRRSRTRKGPAPPMHLRPVRGQVEIEREVSRRGKVGLRKPQPPTTTTPAAPAGLTKCVFSPVCGSDGFTYLGECFMWHGVTKACDGSCPCSYVPQTPQQEPQQPVCSCPSYYSPVCGVDGNTYDNDCQRRCNYVGLGCEGACPCSSGYQVTQPEPTQPSEPVCQCGQHYDPVCGTDGQTYRNFCFLECSHVEEACSGECPCTTPVQSCDSYCSYEYKPVCTVNGNTYDNDCLRQCSGEVHQCEGACPCEPEGSAPSTTYCDCPYWDVDPVCTTDGETIWNGCRAICEGKEIACSSECPC